MCNSLFLSILIPMRIYSFEWSIFIDLFHLKLNWNLEPGCAISGSIFLFLPVVLFCYIRQLKLFISPWSVLCFQYYDSFHCALQLSADSSRFSVEIDPPFCECAQANKSAYFLQDDCSLISLVGIQSWIFTLYLFCPITVTLHKQITIKVPQLWSIMYYSIGSGNLRLDNLVGWLKSLGRSCWPMIFGKTTGQVPPEIQNITKIELLLGPLATFCENFIKTITFSVILLTVRQTNASCHIISSLGGGNKCTNY